MSNDQATNGAGNQRDPARRAEALLGLALTSDAVAGDCPSLEQLAAWHDGQLAGADEAHARQHVAHCDRCYAAWLALAAQEDAVAEASAADGGFLARLLGRFGGGARAPRRFVGAGVAAAAVAAVALLTLTTQTAYPPYTLTVAGQTQQVRGGSEADGATRNVFDAGSRIELLLRPETPTDTAPVARVYIAELIDEDRRQYRVLRGFSTETSDKGALRLHAILGEDVRLASGDYDLLLALGQEDELPSAQTLDTALETSSRVVSPNWLGWRVGLRINDMK